MYRYVYNIIENETRYAVEALGPVDLPITRRGKHLNYHAGKSNYMI
jgi:hypothetical protein